MVIHLKFNAWILVKMVNLLPVVKLAQIVKLKFGIDKIIYVYSLGYLNFIKITEYCSM